MRWLSRAWSTAARPTVSRALAASSRGERHAHVEAPARLGLLAFERPRLLCLARFGEPGAVGESPEQVHARDGAHHPARRARAPRAAVGLPSGLRRHPRQERGARGIARGRRPAAPAGRQLQVGPLGDGRGLERRAAAAAAAAVRRASSAKVVSSGSPSSWFKAARATASASARLDLLLAGARQVDLDLQHVGIGGAPASRRLRASSRSAVAAATAAAAAAGRPRPPAPPIGVGDGHGQVLSHHRPRWMPSLAAAGHSQARGCRGANTAWSSVSAVRKLPVDRGGSRRRWRSSRPRTAAAPAAS